MVNRLLVWSEFYFGPREPKRRRFCQRNLQKIFLRQEVVLIFRKDLNQMKLHWASAAVHEEALVQIQQSPLTTEGLPTVISDGQVKTRNLL
jgi:hypothetical protein